MKASDIDKVKDLLSKHASAKSQLEDFDNIPDTHQNFEVHTTWPNPDPEAPAYRRSCAFHMSFAPDDSLLEDITDTMRQRLTTTLDHTRDALVALGVDPDA